jgi:hypothetical protein
LITGILGKNLLEIIKLHAELLINTLLVDTTLEIIWDRQPVW